MTDMQAAPRILDREMRATLDGEDGVFHLAVRLSTATTGWVVASIGTIDFALVEDASGGWLRGRIGVPNAAADGGDGSMFHTVRLHVGGHSLDLARICF